MATIDADVVRWQGLSPDPEWLRAHVEASAHAHHPAAEQWVVIDRKRDAVVGLYELKSLAWAPEARWCGGWLSQERRGHGLGTEVLEGICQFCFVHLGVATVIAATDVENRAALRQHEKAWFVAAQVEDFMLPNGETARAQYLIRQIGRARRQCRQPTA